MLSLMRARVRFLASVEKSQMREDEMRERGTRKRLLRLFRDLRMPPGKVEGVLYVHPRAQDLADVLDGVLPDDAVTRAARFKLLCVLRMKGTRHLWFLSTQGSAARTALTTVEVDGITFNLWAVRDTDDELLRGLVPG
jgi:hypothetical protein